MRRKIKDWLDKEYPVCLDIENRNHLASIIQACMADIGPKWIKCSNPPKVEGSILIEIQLDAIMGAIDFIGDYEIDAHGFNDRAIRDLEEYARNIKEGTQ